MNEVTYECIIEYKGDKYEAIVLRFQLVSPKQLVSRDGFAPFIEIELPKWYELDVDLPRPLPDIPDCVTAMVWRIELMDCFFYYTLFRFKGLVKSWKHATAEYYGGERNLKEVVELEMVSTDMVEIIRGDDARELYNTSH